MKKFYLSYHIKKIKLTKFKIYKNKKNKIFLYNKFKYNFKYFNFLIISFNYKFNNNLINFFNYLNLIYLKIFKKFYVFKKTLKNDFNGVLWKTLLFNFKRKRFFPSLLNFQKETYIFLSLGMISNRYGRGKNFIKKKITFFNTASYVRKILIYTFLTNIILFIKRTPIYLLELFNILLKPVVTLYNNPFNYSSTIDEKLYRNKFYFSRVIFSNNKAYGFMKSKQKGRLKRKIQSKIILKNRILD